MFCTQCGSEMPEGAAHCLICGAPARFVPPRPAAPAPSASGPVPESGASQPALAGPLPGQTPPLPGPSGTAAPYAGLPGRDASAVSTPQYARPTPAPGPRYMQPGPACQAQPPGPAYDRYAGCSGSPDTVGLLDWLLSSLVPFVPLVGLVMLCIWSFAGSTKPSKRNWARATLILRLALGALFFAWCAYLALTDPALMGPVY